MAIVEYTEVVYSN